MKFIHHITLTSGHSRRSYRGEVAREVMEPLQRLLADALASGKDGVEIPHTGGCRMTCGAQGRCLGVAVFGPHPIPTAQGDVDALLCYIGIAAHSRCGAALWHQMHRMPAPPAQTDRERCPPEPWCAVILHAGLAFYPEAARWLGDFERCIAWAWLERQ